jgi:2-methylisocitrate lyase-like PEP mutase family enzyme
MTEKRQRLAHAVRSGEFVIAPGVYDGISARLADRLGFPAMYMTGYGTVASHLGLPDAGLASYTDMVRRVGQIASGTKTPLIADADTGYGGLLNVAQTVRGYESAGACGIQIEDQVSPKKCGHTLGREVIPVEEMVLKVRVACDARESADTLIVARTDARTHLGLDEAIRRGAAYAEAGADLIFVESPESHDEIREIAKALAPKAKLFMNVVQAGRTPEMPADELKDLGFSVAIYPGAAHKVAAAAIDASYRFLKDHRTLIDSPTPVWEDMHTLMGFPEVWDFDKRWADEEATDEAAE